MPRQGFLIPGPAVRIRSGVFSFQVVSPLFPSSRNTKYCQNTAKQKFYAGIGVFEVNAKMAGVTFRDFQKLMLKRKRSVDDLVDIFYGQLDENRSFLSV